MLDGLIGGKPFGGLSDPLVDVRLRIGIVDNPTFNRPEGTNLNPLDPVGIVNMTTGKICVRWIDNQGGLIRPSTLDGEKTFTSREVEGHGTVSNVTSDASEREMLTLSHPFLWANEKNWAGMNYLPPVGSVVIVGFRKNNLPVLLGYLQSNYQICHPISPGEIMMKGYGNNYTWWQQSDKIENKTWRHINNYNIDGEKNVSTCNVYLILNANEIDDSTGERIGTIRMKVREEERSDGKIFESFINIKHDNISMSVTEETSGDTSNLTMNTSSVEINTKTFKVNAPDGIYLN